MQIQIPNYILATRNQRMVHFVVDNIFVIIAISLLVQLIDLICFNNQVGIANFTENLSNVEYILVTAPVYFLYFTIFEYFYGRTIAKLITKTKVVSLFGKKPTVYAILTRSLIRIIPLEFLTFLFEKVGWHDLYSETVVANTRKLKTFFAENQ